MIVLVRTSMSTCNVSMQVFQRIKSAGLKLKPEKCNILQKEVIFLGNVVTDKGVKPS